MAWPRTLFYRHGLTGNGKCGRQLLAKPSVGQEEDATQRNQRESLPPFFFFLLSTHSLTIHPPDRPARARTHSKAHHPNLERAKQDTVGIPIHSPLLYSCFFKFVIYHTGSRRALSCLLGFAEWPDS